MEQSVFEILIWLLAGTLIGFWSCWFFMRRGERARLRAAEAGWRRRLEAAEEERDLAVRREEEAAALASRLEIEAEERLEAAAPPPEPEPEPEREEIDLSRPAGSERAPEPSWDLKGRMDATTRRLKEQLAKLEGAAPPSSGPEPAPVIAREPEPVVAPEPADDRVPPRGAGERDWLLEAPEGPKDDLKAIRGIGPALERTLNKIGVYHYRQLAALQTQDIEWIAGRLKTFPGRISRDRWVEQAEKLHRRNQEAGL